MPNPDDRRVKMTKKILKETLVSLMREKSIHELSIKKVCEAAEINRSTFYHHYQSISELYDDIIKDILTDINVIVKKNRELNVSNSTLIAEMLSYVERNRELFLVILSDKGNIGIGEKLNRYVSSFIGADNNSELSMYCAQFISAGLINIIWRWLNTENRLSPKDMAGLITTILIRGVRRAVMFSASREHLMTE